MFAVLAGRGRTILSSPINMGREKNHIREGGGDGRRKDKIENDGGGRENFFLKMQEAKRKRRNKSVTKSGKGDEKEGRKIKGGMKRTQ